MPSALKSYELKIVRLLSVFEPTRYLWLDHVAPFPHLVLMALLIVQISPLKILLHPLLDHQNHLLNAT